MIAFFVTMPISIMKPITTGMLIDLPVSKRPRMAPPTESGNVMRMVIGCRKLPNSRIKTVITISRPSRIAVAKPSNKSCIVSASPACFTVMLGGLFFINGNASIEAMTSLSAAEPTRSA